MRTIKIVAVALTALLLATLTITFGGAGSASAHAPTQPATYRIEYRNLTTGQWLTPPNYAVHGNDVHVFRKGSAASNGVQQVAENGAVPVLAAELTSALDNAGLGTSGVGAAAPIAPGEHVSFDVTSTFDRFSLVSMVVCTNDGFAGIDSNKLPTRDGQSKTWQIKALDAGTEINTELRADLVPAPFCGPGAGSTSSNPALAENGVIRNHKTLQGVGDLAASFDWNGPVAEIVVTRVEQPVEYTVTVENLTGGQWLTPPNFAAHAKDVHVFEQGRPASAGVQAVAENGGVPVLAAELTAAIDDAGIGVSGVGASDPIAPGQSATFTFTTTQDRLSVVSMIVCTNDGFVGLDAERLPKRVGESQTMNLRSYDAGTEVNTELRADLVPAPFCGPGAGSTESNPALAEGAVITRHRTLQGIGDLDPALDWSGPAAAITITRNN